MANAYTKLYVHLIFSPKGRLNVFNNELSGKVEKYVFGILEHIKCPVIAIKCMPDHLHILIGLHPDHSVSEVVRLVKSNSSKHLNEIKALPGIFHWQQGYGAFSYSQSSLPNVIQYINNQQEHHKHHSFRDEFIRLLDGFKVNYDAKYLFEPQDE